MEQGNKITGLDNAVLVGLWLALKRVVIKEQDWPHLTAWLPVSLCDPSHPLSHHDAVYHEDLTEAKQMGLPDLGLSASKTVS